MSIDAQQMGRLELLEEGITFRNTFRKKFAAAVIATEFVGYEEDDNGSYRIRSARKKKSRSCGRIQEQVVSMAPAPESIKAMNKFLMDTANSNLQDVSLSLMH